MTVYQKSHGQKQSLSQWLSYLETIHNTEIDLGLARIQQVAHKLNIDLSFAKVITVAGTNGKGTTCAFLENALLAENKTVAVYSSPHIDVFNERLRVNKIDIGDQALVSAFESIEEIRAETSLTYYEYTTLAAFLVLMQARPDIIILEVGLGGRLDATNIIDADIAVITTIDLDHQAFLGNDRQSIGFEKAGILRANGLAVLGDTNPVQSIIDHANDIKAKLSLRGKEFNVDEHTEINTAVNKAITTWQWHSANISLKKLITPHIPQDNVATALMVLSLLKVKLTSDKVNQLIKNTHVAGRTELFHCHCDIMLDVAHNPQAARYLAEVITRIKNQKPYHKIVAVVGMLADKDICNTLKPLASLIDQWQFGDLSVVRAASSKKIAQELLKSTTIEAKAFNCFDNVSQAFKIACENTEPTDLIVVFGSFFTVAEIRAQLV